VIFGADHIQGKEVLLLRGPLEVMQASEEPDVHISNCSKTRVIEEDFESGETGFYYGWSSHKATSHVQSAPSQKSAYEKRPNCSESVRAMTNRKTTVLPKRESRSEMEVLFL
jgi:hypothetical protein